MNSFIVFKLNKKWVFFFRKNPFFLRFPITLIKSNLGMLPNNKALNIGEKKFHKIKKIKNLVYNTVGLFDKYSSITYKNYCEKYYIWFLNQTKTTFPLNLSV